MRTHQHIIHTTTGCVIHNIWKYLSEVLKTEGVLLYEEHLQVGRDVQNYRSKVISHSGSSNAKVKSRFCAA